jgi:hypothetical protein
VTIPYEKEDIKMHMLVRIIVHAKDEKQAFTKAENALNELVKGEKFFDYYSTFDNERTRDSYVDWSHLPPVILASSPEGKHFIDVGWQYTVEGFIQAFEQVNLAVQYLSPEEIMERTYPKDLPADIKKKINVLSIRVYFEELGNQPGYPKYLYDKHEPILSKSDLEFALKPEEGLNVYVIPADVHY